MRCCCFYIIITHLMRAPPVDDERYTHYIFHMSGCAAKRFICLPPHQQRTPFAFSAVLSRCETCRKMRVVLSMRDERAMFLCAFLMRWKFSPFTPLPRPCQCHVISGQGLPTHPNPPTLGEGSCMVAGQRGVSRFAGRQVCVG